MIKPNRIPVARVLAAMAAMALMLGCNAPTQELKRAEQEIEVAKKAGAEEFAFTELKSAEQSLSKGKDLMGLLRWRQAKDEFEKAYEAARAAKDKALIYTSQGSTDVKTPGPMIATGLPTSHTVYPGECLWRISEYSDIYNDPFQWPLIYDANRADIDARAKNAGLPEMKTDGYAHWIFPGQELGIPRNNSQESIQDARRRAGAPDPYMPADK